jgi:hypothetical protein
MHFDRYLIGMQPGLTTADQACKRHAARAVAARSFEGLALP